MTKEIFNPLNNQINDIMKKAKLSALNKRADVYTEDMIEYLKDTDLTGQWNKDSLKAISIFMKTAYKAGFKEALR